MTYLALSAGYRGLGYLGDAELTRHDGPGRALWIEMSFLNLEIDLCEQILAENDDDDPLLPRLRSRPAARSAQRHPVADQEAAEETGAQAARRTESRGRGSARPQGIALARGRLRRRGLSFSRVRWPWTSS